MSNKKPAQKQPAKKKQLHSFLSSGHLVKDSGTAGPLALQRELLILVIILSLQAFHLKSHVNIIHERGCWNTDVGNIEAMVMVVIIGDGGHLVTV